MHAAYTEYPCTEKIKYTMHSALLCLCRLLLFRFLWLRVWVALPLKFAGSHVLPQKVVRDFFSSGLEILDISLDQFDCHLLELSSEQLAAPVAVLNFLELLVIVLKVG